MIFDRSQHPTALPRERNSTQGAACLVDGCGGLLDIYVPAGPLVPVPGTTVIRCTRCGTVETAAMREAAFGDTKPKYWQPPRVEEKPARKCAFEDCDVIVHHRARRYCSVACANRARYRDADQRERTEAARQKANEARAAQFRQRLLARAEQTDRELARARGEVAA